MTVHSPDIKKWKIITESNLAPHTVDESLNIYLMNSHKIKIVEKKKKKKREDQWIMIYMNILLAMTNKIILIAKNISMEVTAA